MCCHFDAAPRLCQLQVSNRCSSQALPAEHDALAVVAHLRSEGAIFRHAIYNDPVDVRYSAIGGLAESLREYFCSGPTAVLLRPDMKDKKIWTQRE